MLFLIWPFGPFFHVYYHFDCETCFYCEKLIFEKMESPLILFILKGENKIRKKKSRVTSYLKKNKSMTKNWFEGHVTYQEGYGDVTSL